MARRRSYSRRRPTRPRQPTEKQVAAAQKRWAECDHTVEGRFARGAILADHRGSIWRIHTRGRRYHEDVPTAIYGVRPARPPKAFAASQRLRQVIESVLRDGTQEPGSRAGGTQQELPAEAAEVTARWTDQEPNSFAQRPFLELRGEYLRAVRPIYDDSPVMAWRRATPKELRKIAADMELAPKGVHLPRTHVRERTVRISVMDATAAGRLDAYRAVATVETETQLEVPVTEHRRVKAELDGDECE